jgi:hypothetical protein
LISVAISLKNTLASHVGLVNMFVSLLDLLSHSPIFLFNSFTQTCGHRQCLAIQGINTMLYSWMFSLIIFGHFLFVQSFSHHSFLSRLYSDSVQASSRCPTN